MASFPELIEKLQDELICSICRDFFTNPMSIECGHSFCHSCLKSISQEVSTPLSCPECKSISQVRDFQANWRLGKLAAIAKKLRNQSFQNPGGHSKCDIHQKMKTLFCEDDQSPICLSCSESQQHKAHKLHCIDEAAEDFREKLEETVTNLWQKNEVVMQQMIKEKKKVAALKEEVKSGKETVTSEFQKVKQFLDEEKEEYLSIVQRQGRDNLNGLKRRIKELSHQHQELRKRIRESMEVCKNPDVDLMQMLHSARGLLHRNESVIHKEIDIFHIKTVVRPIPGIIQILLKFKVDITLDREKAHTGLIISEDLKTMRYGGAQEEVPNNSGRFYSFAEVLGSQSFSSSRSYWMVKVPGNTGWGVGISRGPALTEEFFVIISIQNHSGCHLYAIGKHHLSSEPDVKYCKNYESSLTVGIFLDYERGEISFYDVQERSLIFSFPTTSFSGPFLPFFCLSKKVLANDCSLMICP
ncbi:probable E3 ubiquitin-protein ligase TRIML1 [Dromiciops gliroides]|uniref:probable E3 ubiquitin-protein ligase TRIML1 n=1 Tax=Dromiciops gliroides TaxID=33562 RepID=UPI001CC77679|nr:probable E3 ubiquitin-protein ligase TRIML1 [Dromiciops gliroides]